MRIVRYLKNSKIAVALIVCLLIVQAFTDLALPNYTSQIVDVGIQQSGVEHAATEEMTARTHDLVAMMLPEGDEKTFEAAYDETDQGTYKLNAQGEREQAELDRMVSLPLVAIHYSHQIPDLDLDQALQAYQAGAVQKQQILDMLDKAKEQMGDMGDSIVDQQAIAAARAEYEQLGYNLSDMQMRYLVRIGLTMLSLAALGMAVAILVGFIASRTAAKVGATLRAKLFRQRGVVLRRRGAELLGRLAHHARHERHPARADGHGHAAAHGAVRAHPGHRRHHHGVAHEPGHELDHRAGRSGHRRAHRRAHEGGHAQVQDHAEAHRPREPRVARDTHGPARHPRVRPPALRGAALRRGHHAPHEDAAVHEPRHDVHDAADDAHHERRVRAHRVGGRLLHRQRHHPDGRPHRVHHLRHGHHHELPHDRHDLHHAAARRRGRAARGRGAGEAAHHLRPCARDGARRRSWPAARAAPASCSTT